MLVLSRKDGERVRIGRGPRAVLVTVEIRSGGTVRLCFEGPRDIAIVRDELPELPDETPEETPRAKRRRKEVAA